MTQASRSFRLVAAAALAVAVLSGCNTIKNVFDGRGKDHSKDPAKLVQITPSVTVSKLWSASVGKGEETRVLTVGLGVFLQQSPNTAPDWTGLMAGSVLSVIPVLLLLVFLGKRLVQSLNFSGIK